MRCLLALLCACTSAEGTVLTGPFDRVEIVVPEPGRLHVYNGRSEPFVLSVRGNVTGGSVVALPVREWRVSDETIARVALGNQLLSDGLRGGIVTVTAVLELQAGHPFEVSADIPVILWWYDILDPALFARLPTNESEEDEAATPRVVHPLPNTVVAADVGGLSVRWEGGEPSDLEIAWVGREARDEIGPRSQYFAVREHGTASSVTLERQAWRSLLATEPEEPLWVIPYSVDGGTGRFTSGVPVRLDVARGPFVGTATYQDTTGRLMYVDWSTGRRSEVIPNLPPRGDDRCIGCHAFSSDGYVFAASRYVAHEGTVGGVWEDLLRDPPPLRSPWPGSSFAFPAIHGDGAFPTMRDAVHRKMLAVLNGELELFDVTSPDDVVPLESGLHPSGTHPAWSPDGSHAAWVVRTDGDPIRFSQSDLWIAAHRDRAFDPPSMLISGAALASMPEGGAAVAHPTFSPDGNWIAFSHGPRSSLGYGDVEGEQPQALYLVARTGGAPIRLERAALSSTVGPSMGWPFFLPWITQHQGRSWGWLAFVSRAPIHPSAPTGLRQIWISAIDLDAASRGEDPSQGPFWMPGQDTSTSNLAVTFYPLTCLNDDRACVSDEQCCSGHCALRGEWGGISSCAPP